jgi:hypothetical protein
MVGYGPGSPSNVLGVTNFVLLKFILIYLILNDIPPLRKRSLYILLCLLSNGIDDRKLFP